MMANKNNDKKLEFARMITVRYIMRLIKRNIVLGKSEEETLDDICDIFAQPKNSHTKEFLNRYGVAAKEYPSLSAEELMGLKAQMKEDKKQNARTDKFLTESDVTHN